jgi:hypothetical protein
MVIFEWSAKKKINFMAALAVRPTAEYLLERAVALGVLIECVHKKSMSVHEDERLHTIEVEYDRGVIRGKLVDVPSCTPEDAQLKIEAIARDKIKMHLGWRVRIRYANLEYAVHEQRNRVVVRLIFIL